ncbi:MAG: hypothetical protein HOW73_46170 [Polyangiaceae bacterium]|nr:hypothetical protein [Polyangiaceae bacterium]
MKRIATVTLFAAAASVVACEEDMETESETPVAESVQAIQTVTPFSVVIASDPQFWWSRENITHDIDNVCGAGTYESTGFTDQIQKDLGYLTNRHQVIAMNTLAAGTALPSGYLAPTAVIVNGDLTEYGRLDQWTAYLEEYPGKLSMPVFPGLGNHETSNLHDACSASAEYYATNITACGAGVVDACTRADQAVQEAGNWCGNNSRRWMRTWIDDHRTELESFDPGSVAYSWVKNGIRFIELQNYPAYAEPDFDLTSSIPFLKNELADAVAKGQRVVLNLHDFDGLEWHGGVLSYSAGDQQLVDAITGFEYNVIGIFSGHKHNLAGKQDDVVIDGVSIPWFRSGSATYNYFLLAQFDATGMKVTVIDSDAGYPVAVNASEYVANSYVPGCSAIGANVEEPYAGSYPVNTCPDGLQASLTSGLCMEVAAHRITDGATAGGAQAEDRFGHATITGDFNGDGRADLAVGSPYEHIDGHADAGAVNVIYGSRYGLTSAGNQMWDQDSPGVPGGASADDRFGSVLAVGDFNGDGKDDLAIGAPGEDVSGYTDAGAVYVLYGSPSGLTSSGSQGWDQNAPNVAGGAEKGDGFGAALAAGDFNGDGKDDLAIGVPDEDLAGGNDGGMVHVLRGTSIGLSAVGDPGFDQDSANVSGSVESGDRFGAALAAGDFNGDGKDDLAIGAPNEDLSGGNDGGMVHVLRGTTSGLSAVGDPGFSQDSTNIEGSVEAGDRFGWSLAAGDFNGDGKDDLAIGAPYEDAGGQNDAGMVHILSGSLFGLVASSDLGLTQDSPSVPGSIQQGDKLGWSLATGDFNGDGKDELAIGVPYEDLGAGQDAGSMLVLRGSASGLTTQNSVTFDQGSSGVEGSEEGDDRFSYSLTAGDFNGDGIDDMAIGAPGEDLEQGGGDDDGIVNVLYGSPSYLSASRDQIWHQEW